jgi:hypothetical protein
MSVESTCFSVVVRDGVVLQDSIRVRRSFGDFDLVKIAVLHGSHLGFGIIAFPLVAVFLRALHRASVGVSLTDVLSLSTEV